MARRLQTTKERARRISVRYFRRGYPAALTRQKLTIAACAIGLAWLGWYAVRGSAKPYTAGPMSSAHALIGGNCSACHVSKAAFNKKVSDSSCAACHDGPVHQATQTFTPTCSPCHTEHRALADLRRPEDRYCTQCHSNLKTRSSAPLKVAANISSFTSSHPEFAILRPNSAGDPGTMKFNHSIHLRRDLRGPERCNPAKPCDTFVQLQCSDCHRTKPDTNWPYGQAAVPQPMRVESGDHTRQSRDAYMVPVNYYEHCSACHPLLFDNRFADPVPHGKPEIIHDFLMKKYASYVAAHPEQLWEISPDARLARRPMAASPMNATDWAGQRTADAERLLWSKSCKQCHTLTFLGNSSPPRFAKPAITRRWLTKADFDHQPHQMLRCESCHSNVRKSQLTSDVLLPGIATCQQCHKPGKNGAAQGNCVECHSYHDWTKEKPAAHRYDMRELIAASNSGAP